jgi:hypothetical protein
MMLTVRHPWRGRPFRLGHRLIVRISAGGRAALLRRDGFGAAPIDFAGTLNGFPHASVVPLDARAKLCVTCRQAQVSASDKNTRLHSGRAADEYRIPGK